MEGNRRNSLERHVDERVYFCSGGKFDPRGPLRDDPQLMRLAHVVVRSRLAAEDKVGAQAEAAASVAVPGSPSVPSSPIGVTVKVTSLSRGISVIVTGLSVV